MLNKEVLKRVDKIDDIEQRLDGLDGQNTSGASGSGYFIGSQPPPNNKLLWIDTNNMDLANAMTPDIISQIAQVFKEHRKDIDELYTLNSDVDSGGFLDDDEVDIIMDGGIF